MRRHRWTVGLLVLVPLAMAAPGCGDGRDRGALADDELDRELDLALDRDAPLPTFQDTAVSVQPEQPPQAAPQAPPAPQAQPSGSQPARTSPQSGPQPPQVAQPAPQPAPQPGPRAVTMGVPVGTTLALRLNEELSTEVSRVGDAFTATLAGPVVDASGVVIIPSGATVRGRVTAVTPSTRVGETATLALAFEALSFGGQSYPLQATVERAEVQQRTRTSAAEQAGKVAAGAAAGAILGQVIGRDRGSTLRGAAIGAAAGTAIAMGTADVDAVLARGAELVIRLDQPIQVTRTVAG
jgi:hypothetical protein